MVIYCCQDLIFATKIRSTAEALGVNSRPVRNPQMLRQRLDCVDDGKANDPVNALMVDLDTGEDGLILIDLAKAANANISVVAFGSHVKSDRLQNARDRGADFVMPRSAFTASLPQLLERFSSGPVA